MDNLEEAKQIMQAAGCIKAFPVYNLKIADIVEVKDCNKNGGSLELEKDINKLATAIPQELIINNEKPITCPIDKSFNKYLEFFIKIRLINICNFNAIELEQIERKIHPLLKKYCWMIKKQGE